MNFILHLYWCIVIDPNYVYSITNEHIQAVDKLYGKVWTQHPKGNPNDRYAVEWREDKILC